FAIAALTVGGWYQSIHPRQDRDWAPDVVHGVSGVVEGDLVTLNNVRNALAMPKLPAACNPLRLICQLFMLNQRLSAAIFLTLNLHSAALMAHAPHLNT
ncbi:MAG: hypothetical protein B7Y34_01790, partial [Methylophilales bacterium 16-45-9]